MGIRDRLRKAKKRISNSEGSKRLRGDIKTIKRMAKEHRVNQEKKADERMDRQKIQTKRLRTEAQFIRAQTELAKAKNSRGGRGSNPRMKGPFDAPGAGGMFGRGQSFGGSTRGQDLPGLIGAGTFGDPPGTRRRGPTRRRKR